MASRQQANVVASRTPAAEACEDYIARIRATFEAAVERTSDRRHYYRVGTEMLCLRFAGDALSMLTRALAHLESSPWGEPSLTIYCWDSFSTQTPMPPPPWPPTVYGFKGHIIGYNDDDVRANYQPGVDILHLFSARQRAAVYWVEHPEIVQYWETSFPMRAILHWWCRRRPYQLVHAAAVGTETGGVLLTGKGGSGKSTTALMCLQSSLLYAGDDYVLISNEPQPYVYSLYGTGGLLRESVAMLPHLQGQMSNPGAPASQKALYFLTDLYPGKLCRRFPIRAIFMPKVTGERDTRLRAATGSEALLALAPTTLLQLEGDSQLAMEKMCTLAQSVPKYWLELGTELAQIPAVISDFLERANA